MKRRLLIVVGARPNFVKVAPVLHALRGSEVVEVHLLHTGQHYDRRLSDAFLEQLELPDADFHLGVGSGTHAEQTAAVLVGVERVLRENQFDAILVPGDVNSTLAGALAAAKLHVPVIHLEAGLRSGDWTMPEEINRVLCDRMSDLLLCHSPEALTNLAAEGIDEGRVEMVGNTMIDSLYKLLPVARERDPVGRLGLTPGKYVLVTLHRPALVDAPDRLDAVLSVLSDAAEHMPVVFPMHPRTRARLNESAVGQLIASEPLEYLDFIALEEAAHTVVTDSGGVQEETSAMGVACVTYRETTERPVTTELGTNVLVGMRPDRLREVLEQRVVVDADAMRSPNGIPLWDGRAGVRAAEAIERFLSR